MESSGNITLHMAQQFPALGEPCSPSPIFQTLPKVLAVIQGFKKIQKVIWIPSGCPRPSFTVPEFIKCPHGDWLTLSFCRHHTG